MSLIQLLVPFNGYSPGAHDFGDTENARLLSLGMAAAYNPQSQPFSVAYIGPFASFPAAASVPGAMAGATDLGEHAFTLLRSNGTVWRPVHPVTLVAMRSAAGEVVAAGGSETALGTERVLPAGLVQPGDLLRFMAWATSPTADTNSRQLLVRQGTTSGFTLTTATRLVRFVSISSSNNDVMVDKVGMVVSNTAAIFTGASDPGSKTNTTDLLLETAEDFGVDSYLRCSALPTAGSAWTVYGMSLQLIPGV